MSDHAMLKLDLEKSAHVRVQPDQFNYRSPKKYVSNFIYLLNMDWSAFLLKMFAYLIDSNFELLQGSHHEQSVWHGWQDAAS